MIRSYKMKPMSPRCAVGLATGLLVALCGLAELSCIYQACTDQDGCAGPATAGALITLPNSLEEGQVEVCLGAGLARSCGTKTVQWATVAAQIQKAQMAGPTTFPEFDIQPCLSIAPSSLDFDCEAQADIMQPAPTLRVAVAFSSVVPNLDGAPLEIVFRGDDGSVLADVHATVHLAEKHDVRGPGCGLTCDTATLSDMQSTGLPVRFQSF